MILCTDGENESIDNVYEDALVDGKGKKKMRNEDKNDILEIKEKNEKHKRVWKRRLGFVYFILSPLSTSRSIKISAPLSNIWV